jgi:hypothetical protein
MDDATGPKIVSGQVEVIFLDGGSSSSLLVGEGVVHIREIQHLTAN